MARRAPNRVTGEWRRVDLHLHTPASSDFVEPGVTYLDFLQKAEIRGLSIIAFTDHNTVAGYAGMLEEVRHLEILERLSRLHPEERRRLDEYKRLREKILVLPGFEFTATFGFHILGVFSPQTTVRQIEHLLLSLNIPGDKLDLGATDVGATADVLNAYRVIDEAGGIVIAAHANSSNGVAMRGLSFGGQTKIAFTQDPHLHCLEVTDLDQRGRRTTAAFFNASKPEYPRRMRCIQGSDSHRLRRDPSRPKELGMGDRVTEVLLPEVTFEALRAVLTGTDWSRTRPFRIKEEHDEVRQAREEGPNIVQAFHEQHSKRGKHLAHIVEDVCAMANTNGGTIYIGVGADPKVKPVGVENPDEVINLVQTEIQRSLTPPLEVAADVQSTESVKVVRLAVPRGPAVPYAIEENKIFVRDEAETTLAVRDEIVALVHRGLGQPAPAPVPEPAHAPARAPAQRRGSRSAPAAAAAPAPAAAEPAAAETPVAPLEGQPAAAPAAMGPEPEAAPGGPAGAPRTGVEIVASEERDGVCYHTMRDLRNGNVVRNVTRKSARRLWHYAISQHETHPLDPEKIAWSGDLGLVTTHKHGGQTRYDLVQRVDGEVRTYYGVTADGIHGEWKRVVNLEE